MEDINWTFFRQRIHIHSPLKDVYKSWATQSEIEQWFLESANYSDSKNVARKPNELICEGDTFTWKWNNWDFTETGKILKANHKDKISFTFGKGGIVHIELNEKNGITEVILKQEEIPTDEKSKQEIFVGCSTGWTFWLTNLKAWLEHSITLHAKGLNQKDTTDLVNS